MNLLLKNYVAVEGKDNALEMASVLLKNDYQVFVQHDDCDIYIVAYTDNNNDYDADKFALLTVDEIEEVVDKRAELLRQ